MTATELLIALIDDMFFSMIAAIGFAMLFNVPTKTLKFCAMGGAIAHGSRFLMMHYGVPIEWGSFFAATLIGIIGVFWSKRYLAHPKVFTMASVIPMFPGVFAYKAMIALVQINHLGVTLPLLSDLIENFLKAMFIVGGLGLGLAVPGLLFYRLRPIV